MPVVAVPNQVNQSQIASTTQQNLAGMCGRVINWVPDAPVTEVRKWINDTYRNLINSRSWFGLKIRGQVTVPNVYTAGTVSVNLGAQAVTGVGTAWDGTFVGRQMRIGFSTGFYNISAVADATHLTIDIPWGNANVVSSGYSILQPWVALGPNIKRIDTIVNQRQGYRLRRVKQELLNSWDTWRTSTGWTWAISPKESSFAGVPQFELYPAPTFQQAFPYLAYIQPPDLVSDSDFPYPMIPSDILILPAIANALVFRGPKLNPYYDPTTAGQKLKEFNAKVLALINADDALDPKDEQNDLDRLPIAMGSNWAQSHDDGGWWEG